MRSKQGQDAVAQLQYSACKKKKKKRKTAIKEPPWIGQQKQLPGALISFTRLNTYS